MGFKFTFVTTVTGLLVANIVDLDVALFVLPALAAIFFDFIIYSYSFSIKRIGCYTRDYIDPALKSQKMVPEDFIMWQQFLTQPKTKQSLGQYGNIGVTFLSVFIGVIALFFPYRTCISPSLILVLFVFVILDVLAYQSPKQLGKMWLTENFSPNEPRSTHPSST